MYVSKVQFQHIWEDQDQFAQESLLEPSNLGMNAAGSYLHCEQRIG